MNEGKTHIDEKVLISRRAEEEGNKEEEEEEEWRQSRRDKEGDISYT